MGNASIPWGTIVAICTGLAYRTSLVAWLILVALWVAGASGANAADLPIRELDIEKHLSGYPARALGELNALVREVDGKPDNQHLTLYALYGRSMVAVGKYTEALELAARLEREALTSKDDATLATAKLLRASVEKLSGDSQKANAFGKEARKLLKGGSDPYLVYWAAMTIGTTARSRGDLEESLGSLQQALSIAESADNPVRQSSTLYYLSNLYIELKQPQKALDASRLAFHFAELAESAHAMVQARIAEANAREILGDPSRELAAMEEALEIALKSKSKVSESLVLINLSDIKLRHRDFSEALNLARRSLAIAREFADVGSMATSKANMGFALFGLGRVAEGKRLADEALSDYERTGATAEIASLLGEYSQYLEKSGDYKSALALYHRERSLNDEIAAAVHQKSVLEMQEKYESDKRRREIELLNRQNALNSAKLENRALEERIWWLLAGALAISFFVVLAFYRKLRITNGLLALKNGELSLRSSRDPLTALYNRRYFQDFMREERRTPERRCPGEAEPSIHALLLIDIDLFKQTNDRYGHSAGDSVLIAVARRLRETLRETDMIVRWGGEEFLVFVPATSAEKLDEIATRIMHAIASEPIGYHENSIRVTASIGYASMPLPPNDVALSWERAINLIDMALYMAKLHGRNRAYGICRLHRSDDAGLAAIERDLEKAWEDGMVDMRLRPGPDLTAYAAADSTRRATAS